MSPAGGHLQWAEIKEFGGLWTAGRSFLMPANSAQEMSDCYPQVGGGLRAFFTGSTALITTGLAPSTDTVEGLAVFRNDVLADMDHFLVTWRDSDDTLRLYSFHTGDATWSADQAFAGTANNAHVAEAPGVSFTSHRRAAATWSRYATIPNNGLYRIELAAAPTVILSGARGPVVTHQDRLVVVESITRAGRLVFTDPGTETFGTNQIEIEPRSRAAQVSLLHSIGPSDLLVGMSTGRFYVVQGDLADPTVRDMGQGPVLGSPGGADLGLDGAVYFPAPSYGLMKTGSGGSTALAAPGLAGSEFALATSRPYTGNVIAFQDFVFGPEGVTLDTRTGAWFRATALGTARHLDSYRASSGTTDSRAIVGAPAGTLSWTFKRLSPDESSTANRATSFTWKSAPFRDPSGRQVEVQEVQLVVRTYGANASLTVTVNGTERTQSVAAAGIRTLRFKFRERAAELDVTILSEAVTAATEAPSIEAVRIGTRPGHLF